MKKGNLVLSAICAILGIVVIVIAMGYPSAKDYGTGVPGPGLWPIVIAAILLICSVLLAWRTLKMDAAEDTKLELFSTGSQRVYLTMGILIVYMLVLKPLGFLLATTALEFVFIQWFAKKNPLITLVISVAVTLVIYSVFQFALNVPVGSFGLIRWQ